jgi:hypothetical protein
VLVLVLVLVIVIGFCNNIKLVKQIKLDAITLDS